MAVMDVHQTRFACDHCSKILLAPAKLAGRRTKCPSCKNDITLVAVTDSRKKASLAQQKAGHKNQLPAQPETTRSNPSPTKKQRMIAAVKELQSEFADKKISKIRPSLLYLLSATMVCTVLILLVIGYFALILAVCYGVYYHAVNNLEIITAIRGRGIILGALAYVAPIFGGVILVFFMFKPLLARPGRRSLTRFITPGSQPVFYAFVKEVCKSVNAPTPKRIYIDSEVNASASFKNGMLSLIFPADFTLTVGLPLVASLRADQLGGILAHEFGHFSQGGGMRFSYLIQSVNHWFSRVAFERDSWDDWLEDAAENYDLRIGILFLFAMLCVWISRMILIGFMYVAVLFSSFMLRRMEFNADLYEIQFVGSKTFEKTSRDMHVMASVFSEIVAEAIYKVQEGKLMRNIPASVGDRTANLDQKIVKSIHEDVVHQEGLLFDSLSST